jgi:hypothetical protein
VGGSGRRLTDLLNRGLCHSLERKPVTLKSDPYRSIAPRCYANPCASESAAAYLELLASFLVLPRKLPLRRFGGDVERAGAAAASASDRRLEFARPHRGCVDRRMRGQPADYVRWTWRARHSHDTGHLVGCSQRSRCRAERPDMGRLLARSRQPNIKRASHLLRSHSWLICRASAVKQARAFSSARVCADAVGTVCESSRDALTSWSARLIILCRNSSRRGTNDQVT